MNTYRDLVNVVQNGMPWAMLADYVLEHDLLGVLEQAVEWAAWEESRLGAFADDDILADWGRICEALGQAHHYVRVALGLDCPHCGAVCGAGNEICLTCWAGGLPGRYQGRD
jgi:hypothetical protein